MDLDYRSVFTEHRPLDGSGSYRTIRQRNPWSFSTLSDKAFQATLVKDLQKIPNGLTGLYLIDGHYRSERLDKVNLDPGAL